jgi:hypothetical protein
MGLFDAKLRFDDGLDFASDSSEASTYEIDCGVANANLGAGTPLVVEICVETAFVGGTSVTFELQHSAAGSSYATLVQYPAVVTASLTKGAKFQLMVPREHYRYLQMYYTIVGTFSAGKLTAYIQPAM